MRRALAMALAAFAMRSAAEMVSATNSVCITNGVLDRYSLTVEWATELPPPYLCGIFTAVNAGFWAAPVSRSRPVCFRVVDEKRACLPIDTRRLPVAVFVQVIPVAWTNYTGFHEMSTAELASEVEWIRDAYLPDEGVVEDNVDYGILWPARSRTAGCSQEVPLYRPFRSLSARDGFRIGLDWLGRVRRIAETNAVPGRIYWEGL